MTTEHSLTDIFKRRAPAAQATGSKRTVNWTPLLALCTGHYKSAHRESQQRESSVELWQAYTQASMTQSASNGDKRLADLRAALNHLDTKYNRSSHQRQFHDAFIASCIRNVGVCAPAPAPAPALTRLSFRRFTGTSTARTTSAFCVKTAGRSVAKRCL